MMTETVPSTEKDIYLADHARLNGRDMPDWVRALRELGLRRFTELPLPDRHQEAWRFTNVNPIVRASFGSVIAPTAHGLTAKDITPFLYQTDWPRIVVVDGFFSRELSLIESVPDGVELGGLAEACRADVGCAKAHLGKYTREGNVFAALNMAFLQDGAYLHVSANTVLEQPIHLLFVTTAKANMSAVYPRTLVVLDECAQATIVETYVGTSADSSRFTNAVTEIVLAPGARLNRCKTVEDGPADYHLETAVVHQDRDSYLNADAITLSGRIVRNELGVLLDGPGAECALHGLYLNDGDRLIDNALVVDHRAPQCMSRMTYKGILDDTSKAAFTGKVFVRRYAQKTDSNQLNSTLLLSDKATIDTKPQLEIYADDVKCTHGATVGPPPEKMVFYFRSRGIGEATARAMLTCGFAGEIIEKLDLAPLRDRFERRVFEKYSPEHI